ncbi:flagellar brake protein [Tuberibacillus sp. Marseille-P3662]|uniref:flagellar brake protein n=1 Tax=Tuberibacillus sp. Marseille-P3662 TaxID=1965358 RepID=UPI000A1C8037|nr:flagellar brake domain-containing protein [Tuberibacillus sp. Marseille-P3662]
MFKIGGKIELELTDNQMTYQYTSKIVDYKHDHLHIQFPLNQTTQKTSVLHDGTMLQAYYYADGQIYKFITEVTGKDYQTNLPLMLLKVPDQARIQKVQRRDFVRVDAAVDVAVHPAYQEKQPFTTISTDISGGGLAAILPAGHELYQGDKVVCWCVLRLNNGNPSYVKANGEIKRLFCDDRTNHQKASIHFLNVSPSDQQKIIQFCFDRERYYRQMK